MKVQVLYFASLRDAAGCDGETLETQAHDLAALYAGLCARHRLPFAQASLRAAMDGAFVSWDTPLREGAEIVFVPPVSGG